MNGMGKDQITKFSKLLNLTDFGGWEAGTFLDGINGIFARFTGFFGESWGRSDGITELMEWRRQFSRFLG